MPRVVGEVERQKEGIEKHSDGWDEALNRALRKLEPSSAGQTYTVEFSAEITPNPGQIQRYYVSLT
jgi:hypothetical protein